MGFKKQFFYLKQFLTDAAENILFPVKGFIPLCANVAARIESCSQSQAIEQI